MSNWNSILATERQRYDYDFAILFYWIPCAIGWILFFILLYICINLQYYKIEKLENRLNRIESILENRFESIPEDESIPEIDQRDNTNIRMMPREYYLPNF